ncbi:MAG: hypothetical protein HY208_06250 [Nitrospirae bacterium]|nr:hypothetical protein [Nitrospirota bacterium]
MKGFTDDFFPNKEVFHITQLPPAQAKPIEVRVAELKAVFFVKDHQGKPQYNDLKDFNAPAATAGRKLKVVFKDGETILGTTQGYQPNRPGFFLVPSDPQSNNDRCFVVSAATKSVAFV